MIILSNHQFQELQSHELVIQSHLDAIHCILTKAKQQRTNIVYDASDRYPNRLITKKELAAMLGVSSRYLASQLNLLRPQLRTMGVSDRAKLLPPHIVNFICSALDIEKNDGENCKKLN